MPPKTSVTGRAVSAVEIYSLDHYIGIILGRNGMHNSGILIKKKLTVAKSKEVYDSSEQSHRTNYTKTKTVKQPTAKTDFFFRLLKTTSPYVH